MNERARQELRAGLAALGLALDEPGQQRLLVYADLLLRWNRRINLISRRDTPRIVARHLLDSLSLAPWARPGALADLGSGAGLPGLPLAIAEPSRPCTLIERTERRTAFLRQACIELALARVEVVTADFLSYRPAGLFGTVVSRAVGTPDRLWRHARDWLKPGGRMLLQCGADAAELRFPDSRGADFVELDIPGLAQPHYLWVVERAGASADDP